MIDLRSDTVTRPTRAMLAFMTSAQVGDDQYGEDPSVRQLEESVAALLGKQAALFVPSGTMANQLAIRALTQPGEEIVAGGEAHILWHEKGAASALGGVQVTCIGESGIFGDADFKKIIKPRDHVVFPPTTLLVIENTHNRGGGVVFPQEMVTNLAETAKLRGIELYLDGARLWNASVASGLSTQELAAPFRLAAVALSKGLGCPAGSVLAGDIDTIRVARRFRQMYGGGMRQAGILASAGVYALEHNVARLAEDHENAKLIASHLYGVDGIDLDLSTVQTNIVIFRLSDNKGSAKDIALLAKEAGVLVSVFAERTIRVTTHLDVNRADCQTAAQTLASIISKG